MQKAAPPNIIINSGDVANAAEANALHPAQKPREGFAGPNLVGTVAGQVQRGSLGDLDGEHSELADDYLANMKKGGLNARQLPGVGEVANMVPGIASGLAKGVINKAKSGLNVRQLPTDLVSNAVPGLVSSLLPAGGLTSRDEKSQAHGPRVNEGFPAAGNVGEHADGLTGNLRPAEAIDAVHLGTAIDEWVQGGLEHEKDLPKRESNDLESRQLSGGNLPTILMGIAADPKHQLEAITDGINLGGGHH